MKLDDDDTASPSQSSVREVEDSEELPYDNTTVQ